MKAGASGQGRRLYGIEQGLDQKKNVWNALCSILAACF